jgi:hypothetical protein
MTTLHLRKSSGRSPLRHAFLLTTLALACCALSPAPKAFGVTPAPDGGYPGANTAEGQNALQSLSSGIRNTALGYQTLFSNTTGHDNMASGFQALFSNTTGSDDTANGAQALYKNTTGSQNMANGFRALFSNTTGIQNMANGFEALHNNTTGSQNMANGFEALYSNTTGLENTANGYQALASNITGQDNMANGFLALHNNTTGNANTANGYQTLYKNTTGSRNTANGLDALFSNSTGSQNAANGAFALNHNTTGFENTANGVFALASNNTGSRNIAFGSGAGDNLTTGNYNIDVGNRGIAGESGTIRIGTQGTQAETFIAGISATTVAGGIPVVVDGTTGQLGIASLSSRRFKAEIKPMDRASEAILALKPVTFRYKQELDPKGIAQFGLVAEEVEKVNADLVTRGAKGEVYTVRYEAVNAMLLNEFLKEHRKVEKLEATVAQQQKDFQAAAARQQEEIETLTAGLQRVSAQVEMSRPAPQMVLNNQ